MKFNLPKKLLNKLKSKRRKLEAHTLNLQDAFGLASILSKVDVKKISPQTDALDFISDILEKLSPEEYLKCVMLLTKENEETIKTFSSIEILTLFIEGLKKNQVVSLLGFYRSLGL